MQSTSDEFIIILWVLARLVIFSMLLERALYFLFDYIRWREWLDGRGIKAPISFGVAFSACYYWQFDAVYPVLDPLAGPTLFGIVITAAVIAGGSQGAMVLFQDVLGFSRQAREGTKALRDKQIQAKIQKLNASAN